MQQNITLTESQKFGRFVKGASGFWRGPTGWIAWPLLALLILLILLQLLVSYLINFWNRDFFNSLTAKQVNELWIEAWLFLPLAVSSVIIAILSVWGKMTITRKWREWLSNHMINYWVKDDHYVSLSAINNDHLQNAEYRIAEDARVSTDLPFELFLGLFSSLITAFTFINILWQVGGTLHVVAFGVPFAIPGYLVISALAYSLLLSTATLFVGRHLPGAVECKNSSEAEFRTMASSLRQHGESKDHSKSKNEDVKAVKLALFHVIDSWRILCRQLMKTTFVSTGNGVSAPIIGLLLCTPQFLVGEMSLGQVVQGAAAFVTVQNSFNWLLNNYPSIADFLSSANRVAFLLFALDNLEAKE